MSVHEFRCPDCGLSCQLLQEGLRASMRHQLPTCKTYKSTKSDGQKFLELAYVTYPPKKEDPIMVAFREGPAANDSKTPDPAEQPIPERPKSPCTCLVGEEGTGAHARGCPWSSEWPQPTPLRRRMQPMPARWQPLLDQLSSELRALVHERGEHSLGLAKALADAQPGDTLVGFDDSKLAGVAQAIVSLCAASKGHP